MEDKLREAVSYLTKCVLSVADEVDVEKDSREEAELVLSALANVLCNTVRAAGVDKELMMENIQDIWEQGETVYNTPKTLN